MPSIRLVEYKPDGTAGPEIMVLRPSELTGDEPIACSQFDLGWPEHREVMQDRAGYSGSLDLTTLHGPRTLSFDLTLRSAGGYTKEEMLDALHAISAPGRRIYVYARRDGWTAERRMLVRTNNLSCLSTRESAQRFKVTLSYKCASGVMEAVTESQTLINPPASQPHGIAFPIYWTDEGISLEPGSARNKGFIYNDGNTVAPVRMFLTGRCEDPVIYNRTTGQKLSLKDTFIASTQVMVIDTDEGSVLIDNQSFYSKIDWTVSSWWGLAPGENEIELVAQNADANCQLLVTARGRWI